MHSLIFPRKKDNKEKVKTCDPKSLALWKRKKLKRKSHGFRSRKNCQVTLPDYFDEWDLLERKLEADKEKFAKYPKVF